MVLGAILGEKLSTIVFSSAVRTITGQVGVVDVRGDILPGDDVTIVVYEHPRWLQRSDNEHSAA